MTDLLVPARFCGPPVSGNGGWTSGAMAQLVHGHPRDHTEPWPAITVTLRRPPPLDTAVPTSEAAGVTTAGDDQGAVASAELAGEQLTEVETVDARTALAAEAAYAGWASHPFVSCFTCGPDRDEGDGLCIYPGPIGDGSMLTCAWTPNPEFAGTDGSLSDEVVWAALDCPSGNAAHHHDPAEGPMVLARLRARLERPIAAGEPHVVAGWAIERDGRKHRSATAIYDRGGEPLAWADALWVELKPEG